MATEVVRELIDSGVHFGHRVSRWNPKMAPYIHGKRNLIHIIDIRETLRGLLRAEKFLAKVVSRGQDVLFVGTKRQAKYLIEDFAKKCDMPYVSERWLGGILTNFRTIRSRLTRLEELEQLEADGSFKNYSKKRVSTLQREKNKMKRNLDGIRKMNRLPGALVVVDVRREHIALKEARKLHIPTVCLTDTDSDPDFADILIPGNDDAIRSIDVVLRHLCDAVQAGLKARLVSSEADQPEESSRRSRRGTTTAAAEEMAKQDGIPAGTDKKAETDKKAVPADSAGADSAGADSAGADKAGADSAGADKAGADSAGADKAGEPSPDLSPSPGAGASGSGTSISGSAGTSDEQASPASAESAG